MRRIYMLKLFKELNNDKNEVYLISGFYGFGAIGFLTTRYLISKLNMEFIGYIDPPIIPDFTSIEDHGLSMPHEIFYKDINKDKRLIVLLNRMNPERRFITSFINEILMLIKRLKITEVMLVGGLDIRFKEGEEELRWLKTSACTRTLNAPYFIKGAYVVGPLASILIALQQNNIPALAVFPYTQPDTVDHKAAAVAVKTLASLIGIEIDIEELLSYAAKLEEVEKMIQDLYEQQVKRKESVMHT
ncbi:MAG: PAC2 family protein [Ignisphaera sp.]